MAVNLHTTHYRFGIDELAESTHGWHANLDTNPAQGVIAVDTTFLLRFTVQETGGTAAGNTDQQFACRLNGGTWQDITTTSTIVKAVTTTVFANGADLTKRLTGTGTFESSGDGGTHDGLSGGAQNDIVASGNSETECALQIVSGDVVNNDSIEFRLTSPDFTITNDVVPTLTVSESAPVEVLPGFGALLLAGFAATIVATANINVTPDVGALSFTGFSPAVTIGVNVEPGTGVLDLVGFAPAVAVTDNKIVSPGVGALDLAGFVPTVIASDHKTVLPDVGVLDLVGFSPGVSVSDNKTVSPGLGELELTGFAPTVVGESGSSVEITPGVGELVFDCFAVTVDVEFTVGITKASTLTAKH